MPARISVGDEGIYQQTIKAGEVFTVEIETTSRVWARPFQVLVHEADQPVYVQRGDTVEPRDQKSQMVVADSWLQVRGGAVGPAYRLSITSDSDAVVSVYRA